MHTEISNALDPVTRAIEKDENHPSILNLNNEMTNSTFDFQFVSGLHLSKLLQDIQSSKAFLKDDIPPKVFKANEDICSIVLTSEFNKCIVNRTFPNNLKMLILLLLSKRDYRPVGILPASKLYEKNSLYANLCVFSGADPG